MPRQRLGSSVGSFVDRFESAFAELSGVPHAVAVVNGTAALQIALIVSGVEQGDEVLIPSLTFVATAAAVRHCGAVPHFIDSEERTLGLDPMSLAQRIEEIGETSRGFLRNRVTGRRISAVDTVHTFGYPPDLDAIAAVAGPLRARRRGGRRRSGRQPIQEQAGRRRRPPVRVQL